MDDQNFPYTAQYRNLKCGYTPCSYSDEPGNCDRGDFMFLSCDCTEGSHVTETGCKRCLENSQFDYRAEDCVCVPGTYNVSGSCEMCPENHFSKVGNMKCSPCPEGQTAPPGSDVCYKCTDGQTISNKTCIKCDGTENCSLQSQLNTVMIAGGIGTLLVLGTVCYCKRDNLRRLDIRGSMRGREGRYPMDTRVNWNNNVAEMYVVDDYVVPINENIYAIQGSRDGVAPSFVF